MAISGSPSDSIRAEISAGLERNERQIGDAYRVRKETGSDSPTELHARGVSANVAAVSNLLYQLRTLLDGYIPKSPSMAQSSLSAARSFRKTNRPFLTDGALAYLDALVDTLEERVADVEAVIAEDAEQAAKSQILEEELVRTGGVYVYTFPHYRRHPYDENLGLHLMKVGRASGDAGARIRDQARSTGVPEEPELLRLYRPPNERDLVHLERMFHQLLDAAGHRRSRGTGAGREWFATSLHFLDAIASVLGLDAVSE